MTVIAPPRPPSGGDPEALIEEARRRQRRRRQRLIGLAALLVAAGLSAYFVVDRGGGGHPRLSGAGKRHFASRRCPGIALGTVAFVRDGALATVDLRTCTTRVLVSSGVAGPVQFSPDGRYIAFKGGYVPRGGGAVRRTPSGVFPTPAGVWSTRGDSLAFATAKGGAELLGPNGKARVLLPDGWGATGFAFSPDGRTLAVSRSLLTIRTSPPYHQEIWGIDLATGKRRELFRVHKEPASISGAVLQNGVASPLLVGFSPDGRWLLFREYIGASLAADGAALLILPAAGGRAVAIGRELLYPDFVTWCGNKLVFVVNHGGRQVTLGGGIAAAARPSWRPRTILRAGGKTSWNSVACPTPVAAARGGGGLVVAGGPTSDNTPFGQEHRSLWLVSPTKAARPQLLSQTVPPRRETDELPMWSGDGRWIVYVRTKAGGIQARGSLYAIDPFGGNQIGPIASVGKTGNYYGAYGWSSQLDWHR
ncbi:MAG: hypothetical protein WBB74_07760 [Gaiellaceae bacterium]